jgi:hypothetical protein
MASKQRESLRGRRESPQEEEQATRSLKKAGAGCLTFLIVITLVAISPLFFGDGSSGQDGIGDNLTARELVEVGMTERQVLELMNKPTPPWTVLYLNNWDGRDGWRVGVPATGGTQLQLSSRRAGVGDSPYYAYVFFSATDRHSEPTLAYFERASEMVFHVGRLSCAETLVALDAGDHRTGVPDGSACRP